jgi:hypothetical protein
LLFLDLDGFFGSLVAAGCCCEGFSFEMSFAAEGSRVVSDKEGSTAAAPHAEAVAFRAGTVAVPGPTNLAAVAADLFG